MLQTGLVSPEKDGEVQSYKLARQVCYVFHSLQLASLILTNLKEKQHDPFPPHIKTQTILQGLRVAHAAVTERWP